MAVEKKQQVKPGPAGKTAEREHYIQLMKQGFNNWPFAFRHGWFVCSGSGGVRRRRVGI
jgi:hypothetical protein